MLGLMRVPSFARRATLRVLVAGATCAVAVALVGAAGERLRFGADLPAARARIERDVRQQFATLGGRLETAVARLLGEPAVMAATNARDLSGARELFNRLADVVVGVDVPEITITVYGPQGLPIAWAGRPATVPAVRLMGPPALFLLPSPLGLRLTRVAPVTDPTAPERRVAIIVAEAALTRAEEEVFEAGQFVVDTSVVPVPVRLGFEGAATADAIIVRAPSGEALAAVDVPSSEIQIARDGWRTSLWAAEAAVLSVVLLLLCGPLVDWRRIERSVVAHVTLTMGLVVAVVGARVIAWHAVRLADLDSPVLLAPQIAGSFRVLLASPIDLLLTALALAAIVAVAASSFDQWRQSRRLRVRVLPGSASSTIVFVAVQLAAGVVVGGLLYGYQEFLRTRLALIPYDILHFSLHPVEPMRLAVGTGLVILHAALFASAVLVFRLALAPWVFAHQHRWLRGWIPILWAGPALALLARSTGDWARPALVPALLVLVATIVAAWLYRRYRVALVHASQALRLAAFFGVVVLPSLVFYPSLVDAADRARRQLVETRDAPEVVNQRRNLQLHLTEALAQIDAVVDLADLVRAEGPARAGTPATDVAFRVWSRTVLANQRSTSVELYDADGLLVSRFALELPNMGAPQTYQEQTCQWEILGEVSPFFAEERQLLHAGRGICVDSADGHREVVGSIVVHAMLDYSNLSFISAQSPYVALVAQAGRPPTDVPARDAVEFTVYGWSRRPLYMSGRDAWPLTESVFQRILASRDPFWAVVERGEAKYDVYFLNDRGAIYALGYPRESAFGHLVSVSELVALAGATYVMLLLAGFVYGLIAARTPTSGRALLREVRASFYRKLFIAFVAAAVVPVLALALVTRAYIARLMEADLEMEATRTAASASRVVEDVGTLGTGDASAPATISDDLVVWLSRVIAQDVNIFDGSGLLASSERNLFASGLLPTRTQGEVYRAIVLEGRPSYVGRETLGRYNYLVAAAPVRVQNRDAILTVPLTLREQEIRSQINELDRRVLLAAVLFIMLGAGIGYSMAERIADPVNRLMKATARIAKGDLDARILPTSSDEFRRLVVAFNRMAADLQRQRVELERSHRLAAWADMARQVAHDIKNPLTPIQLNAEHLRRVHDDSGAPLGRLLDECVANILTQVKLLRQIASEFSSFASSPTVKPAPTPLHDLVADVIAPYRVGLADRITIAIDVSESLPELLVDQAVLTRALTNVIENALHAMPGGGTLRFEARAAGDARVRLSIVDTGVGMDRAALERIFEPYFSTRASGTGLGLTIAKRNVELNGGTIEVSSERGKGTTVTLTLPVVSR
jgi:signal transduction histidine kinase